VIAGSRRGARLIAPRGADTRPTGDRVREAVFSILEAGWGVPAGDTRVLDLFAGSGALGIEALSRGAGRATFVESAPSAVAVIRRNLKSLRLEGDVRDMDVRGYLERARAAAWQYDLVFLDPPYRQAGTFGPILSSALAPVCAPAALVVAESDRRAPLELGLRLEDERRYGDTLIRIYVP
jgi:16S rRNA (guanine966-N2)-methyltransferase